MKVITTRNKCFKVDMSRIKDRKYLFGLFCSGVSMKQIAILLGRTNVSHRILMGAKDLALERRANPPPDSKYDHIKGLKKLQPLLDDIRGIAHEN